MNLPSTDMMQCLYLLTDDVRAKEPVSSIGSFARGVHSPLFFYLNSDRSVNPGTWCCSLDVLQFTHIVRYSEYLDTAKFTEFWEVRFHVSRMELLHSGDLTAALCTWGALCRHLTGG